MGFFQMIETGATSSGEQTGSVNEPGTVDLQLAFRYEGDPASILSGITISGESQSESLTIESSPDDAPTMITAGETHRIPFRGELLAGVKCGDLIQYKVNISGQSDNGKEQIEAHPEISFRVGVAEHNTTRPWSATLSNVVATEQAEQDIVEYVFGGLEPDTEYLMQTSTFIVPPNSQLIFTHEYDTQNMHDGAVLEYSHDNGATWHDISPYLASGSYSSTIWSGTSSVLAARDAWTGDSDGISEVRVDLQFSLNSAIMLRWRMATDDSVQENAWHVYDPRIVTETYSCEGN